MKLCAPLFALLVSGAAIARAGDRRIAFERNDAIWIANRDGTAEKKVADGVFPAISPDADSCRV
jgi:hypothetical protein